MRNRNLGAIGISVCLLFACEGNDTLPVQSSGSDLRFAELARTWDEGIPLGNATVGSLVWQRDSVLRLSLDRTDLWDLRPSDSISGPNNRFAWVYEQVQKGDYLPVQKKFDWPYDANPAPSKIPGAAIELPLNLGKVKSVELFLQNALCEVTWENGARLKTFVHASEPVGWFLFENLPDTVSPVIVAPRYADPETAKDNNSHAGSALQRLGYKQGKIHTEKGLATYHQEGWNDFSYDVSVRWEQHGKTLRGAWSLTSSLSADRAEAETTEALERGIEADYRAHQAYWTNYWAQSSISLPDSVLQKQYDNEMYKFGSASREDSYPISLQAVWTADNGLLPPWKGDYHHDLNTQLSYWPAYTGNHLSEGLGFLNTLWSQRDVYKQYTKQYFETDGMNVPGVCTLTGVPMGGWIQYSMSPTVGAWLAQHFYLHWKYSADRTFLEERAYPFLKEVAVYLEQFSKVDAKGVRRLPLSSSPEIFDNSIQAWFKDMTNFDLALMRFAFGAASELAGELGLAEEAAHWQTVGSQLPEFDLDADGALTFAKGFSYDQSHRHFSHALAIHPLGLIDWSQGEKEQAIIKATLKKLHDYGPDYWCGYSYSWYGNMCARAFDGEEAARALRTFAECFCLSNTFHANGDQTKSGKSRFTYRPFTLEGNFAFAAGVQEMLLQSHTGVIRVFPAIPSAWQEASFENLRAQGAFLVSATMKEGQVSELRIRAEQGGRLRLMLPASLVHAVKDGASLNGELFETDMQKGEEIVFTK